MRPAIVTACLLVATLPILGVAADVTTFNDRDVVPGAYAVFFDESSANADEAKRALIDIETKGYVRIAHQWSGAVNGMAISNVDEAVAKEIAATPGVASVTQDYFIKPSTLQLNAPIQIDRIDQAQLPLSNSYNYIGTGNGVHAYVIDTAIRTTHQDFQLNGVSRATNDALLCAAPCPSTPGDHGTMVASVLGGKISGVAKEVRLHGVVVQKPGGGTASATSILSGIQWVAQNGIGKSVVNISYNWPYSSQDAISVNLRAATASLISLGFFVSVSAGNNNQNSCNDAIAGTAGVFTVAGITATDQHYYQNVNEGSGWGPCVSAYAENGVYAADSWGNFQAGGGTSFAAPVAAGIAALYWGKAPTASRSTIMNTMIAQASFNMIGGVPPNTPNLVLRVWPGL